MGSFLIGTGVTLVTFYIALIYGSIAIGLIGFAELVLMLLACLYLLIYCRHITADIRIPLTVAEKGKKVTVQLTVDQTMLFPAAKVRYRVRCRNTFAGYARNFWWNGAGLMRGMQCMEKRVVLSHVGSYEYELVKVRIYDLTGLFYVHKKIKRFADIQVLPELDAVAVQVSERGRRYFGEAESYDDFQPGTDVSQSLMCGNIVRGIACSAYTGNSPPNRTGFWCGRTVSRLPVQWYFCWTCCHRCQEKAGI